MWLFHFKKAYYILKFILSRQKIASFWDMNFKLFVFLCHRAMVYFYYLVWKFCRTSPNVKTFYEFREAFLFSIIVWFCHLFKVNFINIFFSWKLVISLFYFSKELGLMPRENHRLKYFSYLLWLKLRQIFLKANIAPICWSSYLSYSARF